MAVNAAVRTAISVGQPRLAFLRWQDFGFLVLEGRGTVGSIRDCYQGRLPRMLLRRSSICKKFSISEHCDAGSGCYAAQGMLNY